MDDLNLSPDPERKPRKTWPIIRKRDQKHVGELRLPVAPAWQFADAEGTRLPTPVRRDTLHISVRARDEEIMWLAIPLEELPGWDTREQ